MPELDAFEERFAAAYRRYLDEAPTEVDASAVARAVAADRPRASGWAWPWALAPSRWVALLAVVALLVAALGTALFVGSHRSALGFSCPAGTDPNRPGPVGQVRPPVSSVWTQTAFDRHGGRLVATVEGSEGGLETWTFDVCTNTWSRMYPARTPWGFGWRPSLVYDTDSDVTLAMFPDRVWAYDLEADTWTEKAGPPTWLERQIDAAYDEASGLAVVLSATSTNESDPWELWTYDVGTDKWSAVDQTGGPPVAPDHASQWLAYDASVDRLVWYELTSPATWRFDMATGSWSRSLATTLRVNVGWGNGGGEMAYDEATHRAVVFSRGRVIAYDAGIDRWSAIVEGRDPDKALPASGTYPAYTDRLGASLTYDSVNRRILVYGGSDPSRDDVLAFDTTTGRWMTLLEASPGSP